MSLRLMMVNSAIPGVFGGGEKWFVEAAEALRLRGHDVSVVGRPSSRFLDAAEARSLPCLPFGFGGDFDPIASAKALRMIHRVRPDVLLVNFNKDAWLFGRGGKLLGIPLVARHGLMAYRDKANHRFLHRWQVDQLVVNAPVILDHYRALGFDVDDARVILNGVRPPVQKPGELRARFGLPDDAPVVLTFGRLARQKQLDRFVEVARRIADHLPQTRFVVLGDGAMKEPLEGWVEDAGLRESFVIPGFVEDASSLAADADLFLLTSKNEGTPNALLEAMSARLCSLSFDVGAVPLVLSDGLEKAMFAQNDVEGMAARAVELLQDTDARRDLATKQFLRIVERFSFERSILAYESLLTEIAVRKGRSGAGRHAATN